MSVIIFLTLFSLSLFYPRSKFIFICLLIFSWILFGWNFSNGDYKTYENIYNNHYALENYEVGFQVIVNFSKKLGFSYQQFLIACSFVILLLWARFIFKFSQLPALFYSIFLIVFFPLDYVLLRNFLAFSIVLQGLAYVIENKIDRKKIIYKFVFFVVISSLIHGSSIVYLVILPLFFIKELKFYKIAIISFISLGFYLVIGKSYLYGLLGDSGDRSGIYQSNFATFISLVFYQIVGTYFMYLLTLTKISFEERSKLLILLKVNFLMFLVIVLYYDFAIFVRLYRNIVLINSIFIINIIFGYNFKINFKIILFIYMILYFIFMYMYFIFPFDSTTIKALFYNNLLFN